MFQPGNSNSVILLGSILYYCDSNNILKFLGPKSRAQTKTPTRVKLLPQTMPFSCSNYRLCGKEGTYVNVYYIFSIQGKINLKLYIGVWGPIQTQVQIVLSIRISKKSRWHGIKFERISSNFNFEWTNIEFSKNGNKFESLCSNFELSLKRASDFFPIHLVPRGPLGPLMFPSCKARSNRSKDPAKTEIAKRS